MNSRAGTRIGTSDSPVRELYLDELLAALARAWLLLLSSALVGGVGAYLYARSVEPVFEVEMLVVPAPFQEIESINALGDPADRANPGMLQTPESAFEVFLRNLRSRSLRKRYWEEHREAIVAETGDAVGLRVGHVLVDGLWVEQETKRRSDRWLAKLVARTRQPETVARALADLVRAIDRETVSELVAAVRARRRQRADGPGDSESSSIAERAHAMRVDRPAHWSKDPVWPNSLRLVLVSAAIAAALAAVLAGVVAGHARRSVDPPTGATRSGPG